MGKQINLKLKPHPRQWEFLRARHKHRFTAFIGGIGSGKSWAGAQRALLEACRKPCTGMVLAPSGDTLAMATWQTLLDVIPKELIIHSANYPRPRLQLINGSRIVGRIADDPDKLRGPSLSWVWLDEWALCAAGTWKIILGRLREGGTAGPAWTTSTPKQVRKRRENMRDELERSEFRLFRARTRDNPHLHDEYIGALERNYCGAFARQELEGEFVRFSAGVIERDWFKVEQSYPVGLTWVRAWDPAFSDKQRADATAGIRAALDESGNLWLRDGIDYRKTWPDSRTHILDCMRAEDGPVAIEAIASQQSAWQDLVVAEEALTRCVIPVRSDRDKLTRAQPWISRAAQGRVYVVDGPWLSEWLDEMEEFPDGLHDDRVDAISIAWAALTSGQIGAMDPTDWVIGATVDSVLAAI